MEVEKRKRAEYDGEDDGKRTRVNEDEGPAPEIEDDEVEEFFAILRRIHAAVKYFEKGKAEGGRRELTAKGSTTKPWNPSFEREDFEEVVDGVKGRNRVEEEAGGLDLNTDPEVDQIST